MEHMFSALQGLFTLQCLALMVGGAVLGIVLGAIPGLSGGTGITLMLPVTFLMEPEPAIAFLMAIWVGGTSGSYIGSILLGIPGATNSLATVYDGYEMTKKGQSVRALSAATIANFIGTVPSILIAMFASPIIARWAVKLGPWEFFALGLCAITLIITLSKGNMLKGFIAAGMGLLIQCIGMSPVDGSPRFTLGSYYLSGGFTLVCVMLGVFAGKIMLLEYAKDSKAGQSETVKVSRFRWPGRDLANNVGNIIRSFTIGLGIGFLPGLGGALSNVVAYAQAKATSKHPEEFGEGCVDGVIAPEVANNASLGGAVIPMISLGIPGDSATALLLGALTIHGLEAGPLLYRSAPVFVNTIFLAALLGAIFVVLMQIVGMPLFPALLKVPYHYLYPAILCVCFLGAYISTNNIFAVFSVIGFSLLGVGMAYANIPPSPFVLAFVLGNMLETYMRRAMTYADNGVLSFFTRPVSGVLIFAALISVIWPLAKGRIAKGKQKQSGKEES